MLSQTLTIFAGASNLSICVTSLEDNTLEVMESFTVTLINLTTGLTFDSRSNATVNIVDRAGE